MLNQENRSLSVYCPGGCITDLSTLDKSEIVNTPAGYYMCRECYEDFADDEDGAEES